ncbi:unnamed protein product, partial [Amoebophrya sp. A25]
DNEFEWDPRKLEENEDWLTLWAECRDVIVEDFDLRYYVRLSHPEKRIYLDLGGVNSLLHILHQRGTYPRILQAILEASAPLPDGAVNFSNAEAHVREDVKQAAKTMFEVFVASRNWKRLCKLLSRQDRHTRLGITDAFLAGYGHPSISGVSILRTTSEEEDISRPLEEQGTLRLRRPFLLDFVDSTLSRGRRPKASVDLCELIFRDFPSVTKERRVLQDPTLMEGLAFAVVESVEEEEACNRWTQMLQTTLSNGKRAGVSYVVDRKNEGFDQELKKIAVDQEMKMVGACLLDRIAAGRGDVGDHWHDSENTRNDNPEQQVPCSYWLRVLEAVGNKRRNLSLAGVDVLGQARRAAQEQESAAADELFFAGYTE